MVCVGKELAANSAGRRGRLLRALRLECSHCGRTPPPESFRIPFYKEM